MNILWKNINDNDQILIHSWMSTIDKQFLCMSYSSWQETANNIMLCLKDMKNGQFRNVLGFIQNKPAVAMMFGVEQSGKAINLYNIIVNPQFRNKGIAKQAISDIENGEKIFNLKKTYSSIKMETHSLNDVSQNLFKKMGYKLSDKNEEFLTFSKILNKNNEIELNN